MAPKHLSAESKLWWKQIAENYMLEAHHERLLTLAAEAWDRCQQARSALAKDGITIEGREGGMRTHPCVAIERDSRAAFASLIKQLNLDEEAGRIPGRPCGVFHAANGKRIT